MSHNNSDRTEQNAEYGTEVYRREPNGEPIDVYGMWEEKAEHNIEKWGLQEIDTLLLCIQEEVGELTQAYLEHRAEDGDFEEIGRELDDLVPLCIQLRRRLAEEA